MKAIVLSCDKYHPTADHMIRTYQHLWPENPFIFRVPYQKYPNQLKEQHGNNIELIQTPVDIKDTLLTLINDLPDNEWIYWCIDDKYPVTLDVKNILGLYNYLLNITESSIQGVMFCRCRKLLFDINLRTDSSIIGPAGIQLIERKNYYQFWIHQFMRVSVLRKLFNEFPDYDFSVKEMDIFTGQQEGITVKTYENNQKMFVTLNNYASFGESSCDGRMTRNCYESMITMGIEVSESWEVDEVLNFMGVGD